MKINELEVYGIIYKVTNKVNNKVYIGQTVHSFNDRYPMKGTGAERIYKYHKYYNDRKEKYENKGINKHLLSSFEKYGIDSFEVDEEFDIAYSKEELDYKENYYIQVFQSNIPKYGYNNKDGGANGRLSDKTKENISNILKEKYSGLSEKERKERFGRYKESNYNYGKHRSEETKRKISESNKGKIISEEQRKMISNTLKGRYTREKHCNARKVICITTGKVFNCIKDGADYYNCQSRNISYCCNGKIKSCGKHPVTKEKLVWRYYEEYEKGVV